MVKGKAWFEKAHKDLRTAKALNDLGGEYFEFITFLCQQCVEKSMKGFLVANNKKVKKTHSIAELLGTIEEFHADAIKFKQAIELTKYAVGYRYPEAAEDLKLEKLDKTKIAELIKMGEEVYQYFFERI